MTLSLSRLYSIYFSKDVICFYGSLSGFLWNKAFLLFKKKWAETRGYSSCEFKIVAMEAAL